MPLDREIENINIKLIVTISLRYDGHFCVTLKKTDNLTMEDMKHLLDLCTWFDMMDVWSQGNNGFSEKYELPSTLKDFLYSCDFNHVVYKRFNPKEVVIIKYHY